MLLFLLRPRSNLPNPIVEGKHVPENREGESNNEGEKSAPVLLPSKYLNSRQEREAEQLDSLQHSERIRHVFSMFLRRRPRRILSVCPPGLYSTLHRLRLNL